MHEQRLSCGIELRGICERRVEREEAAELGPARQVLRKRAAHSGKGRSAGRSDDSKTVSSAALDDEDEPARRRRLGESHARQRECRKRRGGAARGQEIPPAEHPYLLTNSGLTRSKARPSAGLSARAIAVRVCSRSE